MRLALFGAAVAIGLVIPGLVRAGDPRLNFEIHPPVTVVVENGGRRDALLDLDVHNPGDRRVRVEHFRLSYLEGERIVGVLDPATSLFRFSGYVSDPGVDPGADDRWLGLCLAPPTAATDRVRFEFELVARTGVRKDRARQVLDVPLGAPVDPPVIALPVSGTWRVTQGHTCHTNHRRGRLGGQFAWDLAAVTDAGRSGAPGFDKSHRNDESATFGRPVIAPASGTIISVVDGIEDNDEQKEFPRRSLAESAREPRWFLGNHLVLDAGQGVYVLLAHLRRNSISVKPGDVVRLGSPLARAGNSGNTVLPHVHVQVMNGADPADPEVTGVPALFRDYVEVNASGDGPEREIIYRKRALGDPPEDSLVSTVDPAIPAR